MRRRASAARVRSSCFHVGSGNYIGAELALLPNSVYFNPIANPTQANNILTGASPPNVDPFGASLPIGQIQSNQYQLLNDPTGASSPSKLPYFYYPTYAGPGGVNESYDAADFQNMFLALQTVTPRSQAAALWTSNGLVSADDSLQSKPADW